jgi:hypothetical protein
LAGDVSKASSPRGYLPPWQYEFRKMSCLFCGNDERIVLVGVADPQSPPASIGICEACAVHAHWTWRMLAGDAAPAEDSGQVTRVKVVVSRLAKLSTEGGELCKADHPGSYELVMAPGVDGYHDLPTAELQPGEKELEAAARALASVGLVTWSVFLEPLFTAHSPRGSLVRIYLVTAYADAPDQAMVVAPPAWRRWPPWDHARGLYGLYASLREIWPLRIAVLRTLEPSREQITTRIRKGAAEYIRLQQRLRVDPDIDVSMAKYLRQSMSDDERAACKQVLDLSDLEAEREVEREVTIEATEGDDSSRLERMDPETVGETLEDAFRDDDAGDGEDDDV